MPFVDTFTVALPAVETLRLCRQVMADMGWAVELHGSDTLRCKENLGAAMLVILPAMLDIQVADQNGKSSVSVMHRKAGLLDRGQRARPEASNFRNRLLVAVERSMAPSGPQGALSAEIERLVSLRDRGVLTPAEFEGAKARILGR